MRSLHWRTGGLWAILAALLLAGCGAGPTAPPLATGFPTGVAHPTPVVDTFQSCPPRGDGGDRDLNFLKNRVDDGINGAYTDIALASLLTLDWPSSVGRRDRVNWTATERAAIARYEGVAVRTTGYILDVKHQGTESTNCHATDARDFHVWLAVAATDSKAQSLVIEVTPRVQAIRPGWSDAALFALRGKQVRISGWVLFDQEHPEQVDKTRKTLYEIHPIMHIEVAQGSGWRRMD